MIYKTGIFNGIGVSRQWDTTDYSGRIVVDVRQWTPGSTLIRAIDEGIERACAAEPHWEPIVTHLGDVTVMVGHTRADRRAGLRRGDVVTFIRQYAGHGTRLVYRGEQPGGYLHVVREDNGETYLVARHEIERVQERVQ